MALTLSRLQVVPFHPGWVRTEINPPGVGDLEVDEAVELAFVLFHFSLPFVSKELTDR